MSAAADFDEIITQCPTNIAQGFLQKTGQCWDDSTIIALIYGCKNEIQHKLLNMDANTIVRNAITTMKPINVEPSDDAKFIDDSKKHINYIRERLKLMLTKTSVNTTLESIHDFDYDQSYDYNRYFYRDGTQGKLGKLAYLSNIELERIKAKPLIPTQLTRQNSFTLSIGTENSILELSSMNKINTPNISIGYYKSMGSVYDMLWLISFYNFLFMGVKNYIQPMYYIMDAGNIIYFNRKLLKKCFGIIIIIDENVRKHAISLFECVSEEGNIERWLYDNEGVTEKHMPLYKIDWKDKCKKYNYMLNLEMLHKKYKDKKISDVIVLLKKTKEFDELNYYIEQDKYLLSFTNNRSIKLNKEIEIYKELHVKSLPLYASTLSSHVPFKDTANTGKVQIPSTRQERRQHPYHRKYLKYKMKYLNLLNRKD